MTRQNATDTDMTNNADGGQIGMGTVERLLKFLGADITINGIGQAVVTFPTGTSTLLSTMQGEFNSLLPANGAPNINDIVAEEDSVNNFTKKSVSFNTMFNTFPTHGNFTPTLFSGTNTASFSVTTGTTGWNYWRIGDMVLVLGQFSWAPAAANSQTIITISLPLASTLASGFDVGGAVAETGQQIQSGAVSADTANKRIQCTTFPNSTTSRVYFLAAIYVLK